MANSKFYSQKLLDPRWQKKRLLILQRDQFTCRRCGNSEATLHVHHLDYKGEPWDITDSCLITLCEFCHNSETVSRPESERALLKALKKRGFFSGDLDELTDGVENIPDIHGEEIISSAIRWGISNEKMLRIVIEEYFNYLKENAKNPIH
jgi:hypothetical protein